jgi:hypothetical protein
MKKKFTIIITLILIFLIISFSFSAMSEVVKNQQGLKLFTNESYNENTYNGYLRIYIVEPESRYNMYDNHTYHNGFLAFAQEEQLSIDYNENYENTITWNGDITEDNVFVIAAIFNPIANVGYAYPPESKPFEAYYVDAAAAAYPNQTGTNNKDEMYTHTVFIEEGTATWCKGCPAMAYALHNVSESLEIPFFYAAMIEDVVDEAGNRMRDDLNIYGFPTSYFDGGKITHMGGGTAEAVIASSIEECAKSDVHDLNLSLTVEWLGDGNLEINYKITNLEEKTEQMFEFNKVRGGFKKIKVLVENIAGIDVTNVEWQIMVQGGILEKINVIKQGTIENFPSEAEKRIRARLFPIYGFGQIDIAIQVGTTVKTYNGLLIGRFIIVLK